ncbi:MAG: hypothetical protein IPK37_08365 [Austwickia sp.]|jgi:hypothetical protein|nr:MAG: hypothetical protein IPK37_08365 [Austwickia sp.]
MSTRLRHELTELAARPPVHPNRPHARGAHPAATATALWARGQRRRRTRSAALLACVALLVLSVFGGLVRSEPLVSVARQPDGGAATYPQRIEHFYLLRQAEAPTGPATAVVSLYASPLDALDESNPQTALVLPDGRIRTLPQLADSVASLARDGSTLLIWVDQRLHPHPAGSEATGSGPVTLLDLRTGASSTEPLRTTRGDDLRIYAPIPARAAVWAPGPPRVVVTACPAGSGAGCRTPHAVLLAPGQAAEALDVGGFPVGWSDPATLVVADRDPASLTGAEQVTLSFVDIGTGRARRTLPVPLPQGLGSANTQFSVAPSGRLLSVDRVDPNWTTTHDVWTVDLRDGQVLVAGRYTGGPDAPGLWRGENPAYWTPAGVRLVADGTRVVVADHMAGLELQSWAAGALSGPASTHPFGLAMTQFAWRWRELTTLAVALGAAAIWLLRRRRRRHRQQRPPAQPRWAALRTFTRGGRAPRDAAPPG